MNKNYLKGTARQRFKIDISSRLFKPEGLGRVQTVQPNFPKIPLS